MSTHSVQMTVNGRRCSADVPGSMTLLQFLRDELHLSGVKDGCSEGDCGACTVIYNGQAVKSCLILAAQADGAQVQTVEGLTGPDGDLHPLQQAFMEAGAAQCGFCTPGMLMAAKALLDANLNPSEDEIRVAISGNLCRCTGYAKIIHAVQLAARRMAETERA